MNEQPFFSLLSLIFQTAGILAFLVLIFWRFFIPPTISHLSIGEQVYNVQRQERIEISIIFFILGVLILLLIEAPLLLNQNGIPYQYTALAYFTAIFFIGLSAVEFYIAWKTNRLIPLKEEQKKKINIAWIIVRNIISFSFFPIFCLLAFNSEALSQDEERIKPANAETLVELVIYEEPNEKSKATKVVVKKGEIVAKSGTCYFYRLLVVDASGITHTGYIKKGITIEGVKVKKANKYNNSCKTKPKKQEHDDPLGIIDIR